MQFPKLFSNIKGGKFNWFLKKNLLLFFLYIFLSSSENSLHVYKYADWAGLISGTKMG